MSAPIDLDEIMGTTPAAGAPDAAGPEESDAAEGKPDAPATAEDGAVEADDNGAVDDLSSTIGDGGAADAAVADEFADFTFPELPQSPPVAAGGDDFDDFALPDPPVMGALDDSMFAQADIDALFGGPIESSPVKTGMRAVIESRVISHERLPMLEVVCERMVRAFATSMRNLTSDAIDVTLEEVTSVRFGDFMNRVQLPAMLGVFAVPRWDNFGLVTVESTLIYSSVDALLGGRKGTGAPTLIDGRGFTAIETTLVAKMIDLILKELSAAFEPIAVVEMQLERIETSPRFAAIAGPSNIASVATFRVDMDGRGGNFSVLFPAATIEPVKAKLVQRFMGEKLGGDNVWRDHMDTAIRATEVELAIVLGEKAMRLADIKNFKVGQTIALDRAPDDPVEIQCGGVPLGRAQIGQRRNNIAVGMATDIARGYQR